VFAGLEREGKADLVAVLAAEDGAVKSDEVGAPAAGPFPKSGFAALSAAVVGVIDSVGLLALVLVNRPPLVAVEDGAVPEADCCAGDLKRLLVDCPAPPKSADVEVAGAVTDVWAPDEGVAAPNRLPGFCAKRVCPCTGAPP
jgi:hypothetical protein